MGIFHEHVQNKIFDDFKNACHPKKIEVVGKFNNRGGIGTTSLKFLGKNNFVL